MWDKYSKVEGLCLIFIQLVYSDQQEFIPIKERNLMKRAQTVVNKEGKEQC